MVDIRDDILELKKGNHKTFEKLFREYYVLLCYEAHFYIPEKYIIEELVGDVFRWVWENRDTLIIRISIKAYLVRAVHNACLCYLRQKHPEYIELNDELERNTLFSLNESPLDYVLSKELIERANKAVNALSPQYKKVFELSRYKDMTYAEISEEMGISINAVKLYQKKALARLRHELKEYIPTSLD